jgi:hypothetical protein
MINTVSSGLSPAPRKTPRISANKLAEYLSSSSSTRRKKIISDAKYPVKFISILYKDARNGIKSYLSDGRDISAVQDEIYRLRNRKPSNDNQKRDAINSIAALELLLKTKLSKLDGLTISDYDEKSKLLPIVGVGVSVDPDLVVKKKTESGLFIGALKLHIIKNNKLQKEGQKIVAMLLHKYTEDHIAATGEVAKNSLCLSYDVFSRNLECCPNSYVRGWAQIEDACEEIAARWDSI